MATTPAFRIAQDRTIGGGHIVVEAVENTRCHIIDIASPDNMARAAARAMAAAHLQRRRDAQEGEREQRAPQSRWKHAARWLGPMVVWSSATTNHAAWLGWCNSSFVPQNLHASHPARLARGGSAAHTRVGIPEHTGRMPECNAERMPELSVRVQRPTGTSGSRTGPCAAVHPLLTPDPLRVVLRWLLRGTGRRMRAHVVLTPEYKPSYFRLFS